MLFIARYVTRTYNPTIVVCGSVRRDPVEIVDPLLERIGEHIRKPLTKASLPFHVQRVVPGPSDIGKQLNRSQGPGKGLSAGD